MKYVFDFGAANTGLTPTFTTWKRLDTSADVGSPPAFTEIGTTGMYSFDWAPAPTDPDMVYIADAGVGAPDAPNRYKRGVVRVGDGYLNMSIIDVLSIITTLLGDPAGISMSADIAAVASAASTIDGKVDTITSDVGDLSTAVGDVGTAVGTVDSLLTTTKGVVDDTKTELDATKTELDGVASDVTALGTAVGDVKIDTDAIIPAVQGASGLSITDISNRLGVTLGGGGTGTLIANIQAVKEELDALSGSIDLTPLLEALSATQSAVSGMGSTISGMSSSVDNMITTVSGLSDGLLRALGMLHENSVLDRCVYTENNDLRSARLRVYDTKDHANGAAAVLPDDFDTGKLAEYVIQASYTGANMSTYLMTREFPLSGGGGPPS